MGVDAPRVYFAGPLFTTAERNWNSRLATALRERGFDVRLPQEDAAALVSKDGFDPAALFRLAVESALAADVVMAVLDGTDVDSGTAFECGVAWRAGIPVVGLRTDLRVGGDGRSNVNLMLSESCTAIVVLSALNDPSMADLVAQLEPALRSAVAKQA